MSVQLNEFLVDRIRNKDQFFMKYKILAPANLERTDKVFGFQMAYYQPMSRSCPPK